MYSHPLLHSVYFLVNLIDALTLRRTTYFKKKILLSKHYTSQMTQILDYRWAYRHRRLSNAQLLAHSEAPGAAKTSRDRGWSSRNKPRCAERPECSCRRYTGQPSTQQTRSWQPDLLHLRGTRPSSKVTAFTWHFRRGMINWLYSAMGKHNRSDRITQTLRPRNKTDTILNHGIGQTDF